MPTKSTIVSVVLLGFGAMAQEHRWELAVPAEVTLVGLTAGVRPEVVYTPGEAGSVSRLRVALGVLGGPEQLFIPLSLGYRAQFRRAHVVQPVVGGGIELQHRLAFDLPAVRQFGVYLEFGAGFAVTSRLTVCAMLGADLMLMGGPGFGLGPRLGVGWRL